MTVETLEETIELFTIDVVEAGPGGELGLTWDRTAFVVQGAVAD